MLKCPKFCIFRMTLSHFFGLLGNYLLCDLEKVFFTKKYLKCNVVDYFLTGSVVANGIMTGFLVLRGVQSSVYDSLSNVFFLIFLVCIMVMDLMECNPPGLVASNTLLESVV